MNIKTILSKPIPVVWFRFVQAIKLKFYFKTNFWKKTESNISKKVTTSNNCWKKESKLFVNKSIQNRLSLTKKSNKILLGEISIFDVTYKLKTPFVWNEDWRYKKTWKNNYFKTYSFYETNKSTPYDVKFPWELSRLSFLITVARSYKNSTNKKELDFIYETLLSWKKANPVAYSVNWYPMEVSVRSINLIQLRELLLTATYTDKAIKLLNEILILHGVFLWRNIEYTDVRGNHYSANLTALLLLGNTFKETYKEAKKWFNYAVVKTEKEFHLQFINDGVNFEKSISYHRLVVEFYFISFLIMERENIKLTNQTKALFKKACFFIKDYTKPNQLTPIIGDNDSASVFQEDDLSLNNHSNILQLASILLNEKELNITSKKYNTTVDIFGNKPLEKSEVKINKMHSYNEGGFYIIKNKQDYFIADFGEVGMKGKGGHGHNDLFSFELMYDSNNLIVDSGCYSYTGDLALKSKMKSSSYHNGLMVDNQEIAPQVGNWGISNLAEPFDINVNENKGSYQITGKHKGYYRLDDAVTHQRTFEIENKNTFYVLCTDTITCNAQHTITRSLHFDSSVEVQIQDNLVFVTNKEHKYAIYFDQESSSKIEVYSLSYNYGSKTKAKKMVLTTVVDKNTQLFFKIEKKK